LIPRRLPGITLTAALLMASGLMGATAATAADGVCDAFEVYTPKHGSSSTVVRLALPTGSANALRTVTDELNGIGYAASQNLLYGISTKSHVVTIDPGGAVVDRGKVSDVGDATAGAISGSTLFLRDGLRLLSLDINPKSSTYLKVVKVKWLSWFADVDDFDFGSDALLYGVTSGGTVVSIDPLHGTVRTVAKPSTLPYGTYGAILMAPGRILYAVNNRVGSTSRLYRIPLAAPQTTTQVASFPAADTTDAAGCLSPPPVVEPPSPPPPSPPAPPPPRPAPVPAPPKIPAPARTSVTTTSPPVTPPARLQAPAPPPIRTPPKPTHKPPPPTPRPVAAPIHPDTAKKRRWALTTLILVLGAGAAMAATVRRR
jgi:uncharacterized protein DUF6923